MKLERIMTKPWRQIQKMFMYGIKKLRLLKFQKNIKKQYSALTKPWRQIQKMLQHWVAEIQLKLNRYNKAIECYDKAIKIDPDDANTCYNKGGSLAKLKRDDEAIESYKKARQLGL